MQTGGFLTEFEKKLILSFIILIGLIIVGSTIYSIVTQ